MVFEKSGKRAQKLQLKVSPINEINLLHTQNYTEMPKSSIEVHDP